MGIVYCKGRANAAWPVGGRDWSVQESGVVFRVAELTRMYPVDHNEQPMSHVSSQEIVDAAVLLARSATPVTFWDAERLVRRCRVGGGTGQRLLNALASLHDSPMLTDGGRAVLGEYLRGQAAREQHQRQLAEAPLTWKAKGETVRASVGHCLIISLDTATGGGAWSVQSVTGPILVRKCPALPGAAKMDFEVRLSAPGVATLSLMESVSRPQARRLARRFTLDIWIE